MLRARGAAAQLAGQVFAGHLNRHMLREFGNSGIASWNGKRSCLLLTFDCDFPEDALALPEIVVLLEKYGINASFACVGRWAEEYPDAHAAVIDGGHELMNHSYSHPELVNSPSHFISSRSDFNHRRWQDLSVAERLDEISNCQQVVERTLGYRMKGFRAPHFGNIVVEETYELLESVGLCYSSSMLAPRGMRLGVPVWSGEVLEIPVTTCPEHPFTSFDSWHALYSRGGWHKSDFHRLLASRLTQASEHGALSNIYLDPKDKDRLQFSRIFETIASVQKNCWTPTCSDFADWFREFHYADSDSIT